MEMKIQMKEMINNNTEPAGFTCVEYSPELKQRFTEMFNDDFMQKHTNFRSFDSFRFSSAVIVNWNAEELMYYESLMDSFVKESTVFDTWNDMVCRAADLRYSEALAEA